MFWESARLNTHDAQMYYSRLTELALSMIKWNDMPSTIDTRFLELTLFSQNHAVFFKDEILGFLALRASLGGMWNVYDVPFERHVYASNNYQNELTADNSVIIWNNLMRTNSVNEMEIYANKLWKLDRIIDVNTNAQKTPILISCDESQVQTLLNVYMKYDGDQPVVFGDTNLKPDSMKVLTTGAPYVSDKLFELKTRIWNEALTYLGISNVSINKKERLISDEVVRNQGGTIANRYSRLAARQQACEEINTMFDLNVSVEYRQDVVDNVQYMLEDINDSNARGELIEPVYNGN